MNLSDYWYLFTVIHCILMIFDLTLLNKKVNFYIIQFTGLHFCIVGHSLLKYADKYELATAG